MVRCAYTCASGGPHDNVNFTRPSDDVPFVKITIYVDIIFRIYTYLYFSSLLMARDIFGEKPLIVSGIHKESRRVV